MKFKQNYLVSYTNFNFFKNFAHWHQRLDKHDAGQNDESSKKSGRMDKDCVPTKDG